MDWQTVSSIVIAVATAIYTVATICLWRTTQKSIDALRTTNKLNFLIAVMQTENPATGQGERFDMISRLSHQTRWRHILKEVFPVEYESLVPKQDDLD